MNRRTAPPSTTANNQDVFLWALYLLGGANSEIDVEAIYLKAFELAPARLSWRTRSDLPDYKKTSKSLQSVESTTHPGLVHKTHALARKLTSDGSAWVELYRQIFELVYGGKPVAPSRNSASEATRAAFKSSAAFEELIAGRNTDRIAIADALGCSPASPSPIWLSRIEQLERTASVLEDAQMSDVLSKIRTTLKLEKN